MENEKYSQAPMCDWYHPRMLASIGLKAVISGTFGNYADRRELEAALDDNRDPDEWKALERAYCENKEDIWIDVVVDTGDGFNSTYAIARCVAKEKLDLRLEGEAESVEPSKTKRAKILILGGDEVYPFPTIEAYTQKFKVPYDAATDEQIEKEEDRPHMYAIPGNHDWYDGLGNFIKLFCQRRWIGIWCTKQHRSYFALPLPNRYWIWATDIQLNSDIDAPQLQYFQAIAKDKMEEGDKVILITAEPAWVFNVLMEKDRSFNKLKFFVDNYIKNENCKTGKKFKLAATITGDLHHYSRYQREQNDNGHQYITAGGGGAFLHETHNLPKSLTGIGTRPNQQQCIFPKREDSQRLMFWNFIFPFKAPKFTLLLWGIFLFFFMMLQNNIPFYFKNMYDQCSSFLMFYGYTGNLVRLSPGTILISVAIIFGFAAFADTKVKKKGTKLVGFLHGLCQLKLLYVCMYFVGIGPMCGVPAVPSMREFIVSAIGVLAVCGIGALASGFLFGIYLFLTNRFMGMHINEASSSLGCEDYKNFLRLHVTKDGVTIYPIGIRKVPRKWTTHSKTDPSNPNEQIHSFTGEEEPKPFLIEPPIEIKNSQL